MDRRSFLGGAATLGAAALAPKAGAAAVAGQAGRGGVPLRMYPGHQHDHSETTLRALAAFGVEHICSGQIGARIEQGWSVEDLTRLRRHVESFGIKLDCVPLPMSSREIAKAERPEILLAKEPEREKALEDICTMIRNCGRAGIPMVKYNLTFIGVVRSERVKGRGGASLSALDYRKLKPAGPTEAGTITEEIYWDRITHFLKRVVPVAEEAKVRLACHPQDPGLPPETGWRGVSTVLASVDGLKRFVRTVPSANHGLNFCQGTICEMLRNPNEEIHDIIRHFAREGKIFNVHFRNIRGGYLNFVETLPDDGDVDMMRALRTYREVGYEGMVMPDHVPQIEGDTGGHKAFAFSFGYIQALLEQLRREA